MNKWRVHPNKSTENLNFPMIWLDCYLGQTLSIVYVVGREEEVRLVRVRYTRKKPLWVLYSRATWQKRILPSIFHNFFSKSLSAAHTVGPVTQSIVSLTSSLKVGSCPNNDKSVQVFCPFLYSSQIILFSESIPPEKTSRFCWELALFRFFFFFFFFFVLEFQF